MQVISDLFRPNDQMKKQILLRQEDFERLLGWLSADREKAGEEYEAVRRGLVRLFLVKGCGNPQDLADETINRVATKLSQLDLSQNLKPIAVFYGFAKNVYLEEVAANRKEVPLDSDTDVSQQTKLSFSQADEFAVKGQECLKHCLQKLEISDRRLFVKYYCTETADKARFRLNLAGEMNCTLNALQTKVHRLKLSLRDCMKKCLNRK
jgi:DNA-directed RNA polymerase specialized sigma24 family protein